MTTSRVALVTTVGKADDDPSLISFIRYHLRIGFERIFVFFDEPTSELAEALADDDRVVAAVYGDDLRACWAEWPELQRLADHEPIARQVLNTELAVQLARNDGVEWMIHLAPCELVCTEGAPIGDVIGELGESVGQATLRCLEAIPETADVARPFEEVTLFKRNRPPVLTAEQRRAIADTGHAPAGWFLQCEAIRSAVRLELGIQPTSHYTFSVASPAHTVAVARPQILRYAHAGLEAFARRYATWRPLGPGLHGHVPLAQAVVDALLGARQAVASGESGTAAYYRDQLVVSDPQVSAALVASGLCERIELPTQLFHSGEDS